MSYGILKSESESDTAGVSCIRIYGSWALFNWIGVTIANNTIFALKYSFSVHHEIKNTNGSDLFL